MEEKNLVLCAFDDQSVDEVLTFLAHSRARRDMRVVYTVRPAIIRSVLLSGEMFNGLREATKGEDWIILLQVAIWDTEDGAPNDSPLSKPTTLKEHQSNCDRLALELSESVNYLKGLGLFRDNSVAREEKEIININVN